MTGSPARARVEVSRCAGPDLATSWGRTVADLDESHLAHAAEWLAVIREAYGHEPLYLTAEDGDGGRGILPAFIVRRPVLGSVVSSMPFLDGGGPCSSSAALAEALVAKLTEEAWRAGAGAVELRCGRTLGVPWAPLEHKVNLALDLPSDAARLWQQLDGGVRNQVRKAGRSGLSVEFGGAEKLPEFYGIFAARMHELGSPVHGRPFFAAVVRAFGEGARLALVRKRGTAIGGLVALAFKDTLVVPWASCLRPYLALCPNMLLYWETIRAACAEGFRRFDFGRSSRGSGTYRFKRQWGARERPLFWYTIPTRGRARPRPEGNGRAAFLAGSWRRLPLGLTTRLGPHLRKYLTQ